MPGIQHNNKAVIFRKEAGVQVAWIHQDSVMQYTRLTEEYLRMTARRRYNLGYNSWRYKQIGSSFYYSYNDIPDRAPACYRSRIPAPVDLAGDQNIDGDPIYTELYNRIESALNEGYKKWYINFQGRAQLVSLSRAAATLEVILNFLYDKELKWSLTFFNTAGKVIGTLQVPYLPKNARRLKEKADMAIKTTILDVVQPPRENNQNARKITDKVVESWAIQMRGMGQNYTNSFIIRKIKELCELTGKTVPSDSWFNNVLAEKKVKWMCAPGRFGLRSKYSAIYKGYVPIANALFSGDCWQMDGSRINFIPHTGADGKEHSLYVIVVRDVHSGFILGYHFDTKEDRWGYINALKMAVNKGGYLPFSLTTDRFPGHNTDEWKAVEARIQGLGVEIIRSSKATGKANVERWFSTLQMVFMQGSDYYYGEGVQSRHVFAHRSAEYLTKAKKEARKNGFDFDDAWREAAKIIEAYNNTELSYYSRKFKDVNKSPVALHDESDKPHVFAIDLLTNTLLFGLTKKVAIRSNGMILTEIMRVTYTYVIDDVAVIAKYASVLLNYDLEDLSTVYLYKPGADGQLDYLCTAYAQREVQMYGPDRDYSALGKAEARIKRIDDYRNSLIDQHGDVSELELLLGGLNAKDDYAAAETAWLQERDKDWQDHGQPRIITQKSDEDKDDYDNDVFDIRHSY